MGHQPGTRRDTCQDTARGQVGRERGHVIIRDIDKNHIGLRLLDRKTDGAKSGGQPLRVVMILGETLHMVLERV